MRVVRPARPPGADGPGRRTDPVAGAPVVTLGFTPAGKARWEATTRRVAQRGRRQAGAGGAPDRAAAQHVAIVLDDRLLSVPFIDGRRNPAGLDAGRGVEIAGGFTVTGARTLVALLRSGGLPAQLPPTGERH